MLDRLGYLILREVVGDRPWESHPAAGLLFIVFLLPGAIASVVIVMMSTLLVAGGKYIAGVGAWKYEPPDLVSAIFLYGTVSLLGGVLAGVGSWIGCCKLRGLSLSPGARELRVRRTAAFMLALLSMSFPPIVLFAGRWNSKLRSQNDFGFALVQASTAVLCGLVGIGLWIMT